MRDLDVVQFIELNSSKKIDAFMIPYICPIFFSKHCTILTIKGFTITYIKVYMLLLLLIDFNKFGHMKN